MVLQEKYCMVGNALPLSVLGVGVVFDAAFVEEPFTSS